MKTTQNERNMISRIGNAENNDGDPSGSTWTECVCETHADAGTLSSLEKKGLIRLMNLSNKREATVWLTADGLAIFHEIAAFNKIHQPTAWRAS